MAALAALAEAAPVALAQSAPTAPDAALRQLICDLVDVTVEALARGRLNIERAGALKQLACDLARRACD